MLPLSPRQTSLQSKNVSDTKNNQSTRYRVLIFLAGSTSRGLIFLVQSGWQRVEGSGANK